MCVCVCVLEEGETWFHFSQVVGVPLRVWLGDRKVGLWEVWTLDGADRSLSGFWAPKVKFKIEVAQVCLGHTLREREGIRCEMGSEREGGAERGRTQDGEGLREGREARVGMESPLGE